MWGDFRREEDRTPLGSPPEGPTGWIVGVGLLLLMLGLAGVVVALTTYTDWLATDARGDHTRPYAWVPGVLVALAGIGVFAWGWWRHSHAE
jgi:hypothetical protein